MLFLGLIILLMSQSGLAWDDHYLINRAALQGIVTGSGSYVPLEEALPQGETPDAFRRRLRIHTRWNFDNRLGEAAGRPVSLWDVVSIYGDEPDGYCDPKLNGPDQNLFEPDQYESMWEPDFEWVGGRKGFASQGFRHLYFPGQFRWAVANFGLQIPMRPVGQAPQRAQEMLGISKEFAARGQTYWQYRMLAWALHYMQDMLQPLHTTQIPRAGYFLKGLRWNGLDVEASVRRLTHSHFHYEAWVALELRNTQSPLYKALEGRDEIVLTETIAPYLKDKVIPSTSTCAGTIARLTDDLIIPFDPKAPRLPPRVFEIPWRNGSPDAEKLSKLTSETARLFQQVGKLTRALVPK